MATADSTPTPTSSATTIPPAFVVIDAGTITYETDSLAGAFAFRDTSGNGNVYELVTVEEGGGR